MNWLLSQSEINELLALVYYDCVQNVVPFYDQRSVIPTKDATWMELCHSSMNHFEKAIALKYVSSTVSFLFLAVNPNTYSFPRALYFIKKSLKYVK